jgi:hypothetical protein
MSRQSNESLKDQSREFHDTDGTAWHVRIEQGGGVPGEVGDAPPVAVLIFRSLKDNRRLELGIVGDPGEWDLGAYPEIRLRALLHEAQAHAKEPAAE